MRYSSSQRRFCCFASVVSPGLYAQFQPPNPDELKMTADPKAPGADAVYLDIEEIANDPMHYQSYYARIKVLTEKGKELATVELPYLKGISKITDIKGRTIHPDGTVIPLTVKAGGPAGGKDRRPADPEEGLYPAQRRGGQHSRVQLRDCATTTIEFSSPSWEIQRPYFVHKAHYPIHAFQGFHAEWHSRHRDQHGTDRCARARGE